MKSDHISAAGNKKKLKAVLDFSKLVLALFMALVFLWQASPCLQLRTSTRSISLALSPVPGNLQTLLSVDNATSKAASGNHSNSIMTDIKQHKSFETVVPDLSNYTANVLPDVARQVLALERQGRGRKLIAMSLYGDNPRYLEGALLNAVLAKRDWPGWTLRIYHGEGVPEDAFATLRSLGVELVHVQLAQNPRLCMYWRFFATEDPTATRIIVRDVDARLTLRDRAAVQEWEDSSRLFHTMHDSRWHDQVPVLGGMWGAVGGLINPRMVEQWRQSGDQNPDKPVWRNDQIWLKDVVWPLVSRFTLDHSSWYCGRWPAAEWRPFPVQRLHLYDFVGNTHKPGNKFHGDRDGGECPVQCRKRPEWRMC